MTDKNYMPSSQEDLASYIEAQVTKPQDYNSTVEAIVDVTISAFNYAARELGITGFQASMAELEFFRRSRHLDGPFAFIQARDMLYPQYNISEQVANYLDEWKSWAKVEAEKLLAENDEKSVHPSVWQHWKDLAEKE